MESFEKQDEKPYKNHIIMHNSTDGRVFFCPGYIGLCLPADLPANLRDWPSGRLKQISIP